jgi:predicted ribosomally synthesized peptide with SipW-like signal peptide
MEETVFYVLGIGLVVVAVALSAIGLRWEGFPGSRGLQVGVAVALTALVGATGTFAWLSAEEEQEHREAELSAEEAEQAEGEPAEEEGDVAETPTAPEGVDGAQVFVDAGCGGCHTLEAAGTTAQTGPNLDGALPGQSPSEVETSIVDPNKDVAEGFPPNVMPDNFGETLTPEELEALVQYLVENAGAGA